MHKAQTKAFTGHGFSLQKRTLALDCCTGSLASFFPTLSELENQHEIIATFVVIRGCVQE